MERKKGYKVWLFGASYWHRTYKGAKKRSLDAQHWCNGEHNQIVNCATGRELTFDERDKLEEEIRDDEITTQPPYLRFRSGGARR